MAPGGREASGGCAVNSRNARWLVGIAGVALVVWIAVEYLVLGAAGVDVDAPDASVLVRRDAPADATLQLPVAEQSAPELLADAVGSSLQEATATGASAVTGAPQHVGEPVAFQGTVVDHVGAPVAGALVYHVPNQGTLDARGIDGLEVDTLEIAELASATTDREGRFEILADHVVSDSDVWNWADGTPRLVVVHDGFATHFHECTGLGGSAYDAGVLAIEPGATIVGRLVDEAGRPVPDVFVSASHKDYTPLHVARPKAGNAYNAEKLFLSGRSDAHGMFRTGTFWQGRVNLWISPPGYLPVSHSRTPVEAGREHDVGDLVLLRGQAVTGVVTDTDGVPVLGAAVHVTRRNRMQWLERLRSGEDTILVELARFDHDEAVRTAEDGTFSHPGLEPANHSVYVDAEGFEPVRIDDVLPDGAPVQARLTRHAVLLLDVTDRSEEGVPIANAVVTAVRRSNAQSFSRDPQLTVLEGVEARDCSGTQGTPDGFFLVERLGTWRTELLVSAPGFATSGFRVLAAQPPETVTRTVRLARESIVRGFVRDTEGHPIADATVSVKSPEAERVSLPDREETTDAEGAYEITGLKHGDWTITATEKHHLEAERLVVVTSESLQEDVDFELEPAGAFFGTVLQADGTPRVGKRVYARLPGDDWSHQRETKTDTEGAYLLEGLRPGVWKLLGEELALGPGERRRFDIREEVKPVITGRVWLGTTPRTDSIVIAVSAEDREHFSIRSLAHADDDGRYELTLPPGAYDILASGHSPPIGSTGRVRVELGPAESREVDLHFGGALVAGRIVNAMTGEPVPAAYAQLNELVDGLEIPNWPSMGFGGTTYQFAPKPDDEGRFEFPHVEPGTYTLYCNATGYLKHQSTIEVSGSEASDLLIELPVAARIKGRAMLPTGVPVADNTNVFVDPDGEADPEHNPMRRTKNGAFEFKDLPPGGYRVILTVGYYGEGKSTEPILAEDYVVLEAGETETIEFIVQP